MSITNQFQDELRRVFAEAAAAGLGKVTIRAGDLHSRVGGYPGRSHRLTGCCGAMRSVMNESRGDRVLRSPPKGNGASLVVSYVLPRPVLGESAPEAVADLDKAASTPLAAGASRPHVHPEFLVAVEALNEKFEKLSHMSAVKPSALPANAPSKGVYLFSEGARPMYVGRTKNLKQRVGNHCSYGSRENQAVFAFKLAREAAGKPRASYATDGSRAALMMNPAFATVFREAKQRVRRMDLRFVEETDALRQALLEMYVAVVLRTPYNDFDTH